MTVADNAQILNFDSALVVESGTITVMNAQIAQDGGFVRTTNATMHLFDSEYHLTNGVFEAGAVWIGLQESSGVHQYGGTAVIADLIFPFTSGAGTGSRGYSLYGGVLDLPGGLALEGRGGSTVSYLQEGGTNRTTDVLLQPGLNGPSPSFTLNGGLLVDDNVLVWADSIVTRLRQNGGTHSVSNLLQLRGGTRTGEIRPAIYHFNGGTLSANRLLLESHGGDAFYIQSNGVAQIEEIQADGYWVNNSELILVDGTLSASNLSLIDGANMQHHGGILVVTNQLTLSGYRELGFRIYSRYEFLGGTLLASNIIVGGDWIIGSSSGTNRISNPGTVSLAQTLQISNAVEQLGRFILTSNATIDLAGNASRLAFANSSGEDWAAGVALMVDNWGEKAMGSHLKI